MEPKKILQVTTIGITAYCFLRSWFSCLTSRGHRVVLATTAAEYVEELRASGAEVINIPIARSVSPLADLVSLFRLWKLIRKEKFDVVHTYTTKAGFIGRLAARLAGVPVVLHTIYDPPHNSARNPLLKCFYIIMERLAATWADHLVTISYANYDEIRKKRMAPLEKLTVIRNGIELKGYELTVDRENKRRELSIPLSAKVVGMVARLEAAKGHIYLLQAVQEVVRAEPEAFFVLVGRGHLRDELEEAARRLGIAEHVLFTGFREDMLEIMTTFHIFTLPSLWEGLGIVLLEAMAFRLPVVASRVGGITDVVVEGETGLLVPPRDPAALAAALVVLLKDPEKRKAMGEKGYRRVAEEFRDDRVNEEMLALYERLFEEKKKHR